MSIQEIWTNFKRFVTDSEVVLVVLIVSVALCSFWLGRLSVLDHPTGNVLSTADTPLQAPSRDGIDPVTLEPTSTAPVLGNEATALLPLDASTGYVASKSGTKYHLPWCSGAQRIKEENKVWFATKEDAEAAGYTPAANCKGL